MNDRLPGYINFERYERNQAQLKVNKAAGGGTVRAGSALLSGVLICGRRGLRMLADYNNNGHAARYVCSQMQSCYGEAFCQPRNGSWNTRNLYKVLTYRAFVPFLANAEQLAASQKFQ